MRHNIEWKVDLAISGPIAVDDAQSMLVEKGHRDPFWTPVSIKNAEHGVKIEVNARASSIDEANSSAVYFVGQMLDVLCLRTDMPLQVSLFGPVFRPLSTHVKRIISGDEWQEAFQQGREHGIRRTTFARALSWYRKGLGSEDPLDKLLAFWVSIEAIGSKYAKSSQKTEKGIVNKICDCFDQLWGDVSNWRVIPNEADWVNKYNNLRNDIAHGVISVDIKKIQEISTQLPKLRELAYVFLSDWEQQGVVIESKKRKTKTQTQQTLFPA